MVSNGTYPRRPYSSTNRYHFFSVFDLKTVGPSPRARAPLPTQSATKPYDVSVRFRDFSAVMNFEQGEPEDGSRSSLVKR